jgi:DNA-binding beta-propeller fold protein YncE
VYGRSERTLFRYNPATKQQTPIADISALKSPSQVNVDPRTGNIYVIENASYDVPSTLYIYDRNGNCLKSGLQIGYGAQSVKFAR